MMLRAATTTASALVVSLLAACGSMSTAPMYSQDGLPAAVQVPTGNKVAMETVGVGEITYQCNAKKDMADQFEWVFVGPNAKLNDRSGKQVGKYYGPPRHLGEHGWFQADRCPGCRVAQRPRQYPQPIGQGQPRHG